MLVYHKNQIVEAEKLQINPTAPGFQFGMGFFTTLKYQQGVFPHLALHLKRLHNSLKTFGFPVEKISPEKALAAVVSANKLAEARIKIIVYIDVDNIGKYIIIPQPLVINKKAKILKTKISIRGTNLLYRHKSLNFFENIYWKKLLEKEEVDDFLFIDHRESLLEAISSNIFFMKNNKLITPEKQLPILKGIIREILCNSPNIKVEERVIKIEELKSFEACFLTNSIQEITPVAAITHKSTLIQYEHHEHQYIDNLLKEISVERDI